MRSNVRTLNDIRHSNSENGNDNNNGLIIQSRSTIPALRLRLLHPGNENVDDNLNEGYCVENNCSRNVGVSQASKVIPTGESVD